MSSTAALLNTLSEDEARRALLRCCGCRHWVEIMLGSRPFADDETLFRTADEAWTDLSREDWLEAFSHHPRIGERELETKAPAATRKWSAQEQAGAAQAPEERLRALEEGNRAYEGRFGHVFLICASGLDADTMLAALRQRLGNDPETELHVAAAEHAKITRLRLVKLAEETPTQEKPTRPSSPRKGPI